PLRHRHEQTANTTPVIQRSLRPQLNTEFLLDRPPNTCDVFISGLEKRVLRLRVEIRIAKFIERHDRPIRVVRPVFFPNFLFTIHRSNTHPATPDPPASANQAKSQNPCQGEQTYQDSASHLIPADIKSR